VQLKELAHNDKSIILVLTLYKYQKNLSHTLQLKAIQNRASRVDFPIVAKEYKAKPPVVIYCSSFNKNSEYSVEKTTSHFDRSDA